MKQICNITRTSQLRLIHILNVSFKKKMIIKQNNNIVVNVMSVVIIIHLYFNLRRLIIESHTLHHERFQPIFPY